jgi:hypothetical protein
VEFMDIVYRIEQVQGILGKSKTFSTITGSVLTDVVEIAPPGSGVCP